MDEVAATARTSKTVFYRHFTDRAGLYTAVAERVDATIIRDLTRAATDPASDGSRDGGRAVIRGVIAAPVPRRGRPAGLPLHRQRADNPRQNGPRVTSRRA